ncbi:hypothetical protein OROMI_006741 [Orobanche minor]
MTMFKRFSRTFRENPSLAKMLIVFTLARVESHYHKMPYGEILKQGCTIDDAGICWLAEWHSFTVRHASHCETRRILEWAYKQLGSQIIQIQQDNDAYKEELLDYDEEEEKSPELVIAKVNSESKVISFGETVGVPYWACFGSIGGYVGIHSSGFRDFLLKPELLRAIVDSNKEVVCISLALCKSSDYIVVSYLPKIEIFGDLGVSQPMATAPGQAA